MMEAKSFKDNFIRNKRDSIKLKIIVENCLVETISEAIVSAADDEFGLCVWSSALSLVQNEEHMFEIIKDVS